MLRKTILSSLALAALLGSSSGICAEEKKAVIILLGPPGAGKGSQAVLLEKKNQWTHISTGDLLREHVKRGSAFGIKAKAFMEQGELVPDEIILDILFERVSSEDCAQGYILDGFPRTVSQARALHAKLALEKVLVVNFDVPDAILIERVAQRQLIENRSDDSQDVLLNRLSVYKKQTEPLIEFYREHGNLITFDGEEEKLALFERVQATLEKCF